MLAYGVRISWHFEMRPTEKRFNKINREAVTSVRQQSYRQVTWYRVTAYFNERI